MNLAHLACSHTRPVGDGHHIGEMIHCDAREHGHQITSEIVSIDNSDSPAFANGAPMDLDGPYAAARERARLQLEADLAGAALDRARANLRDAAKRVIAARHAVDQAQDTYRSAQASADDTRPERTVTEIRQWVEARKAMYEDTLQHMVTPGGREQVMASAEAMGRVLAFIDGEDL